MKPNVKRIIPALMLGFAFQAAWAGNITDINVSVLPDQRRVIKVKFDSDIVKPSGFIYTSPARIALDFAGTKIQLPQKQLSYNDTLLNHIVAADDNSRARISLSLSKEGQYDTEVKGNELWVYVSESAGSSAPAASASSGSQSGNVYSPPPAADVVPLNINFRVGSNKSGIINYSSAYTGQPQVKIQNDRIVITLKNYPLATQDQKNLDTTSFQTPVRSILVRRLGNDTQITIRNQGSWDHRISQKNGRQEIRIVPASSVSEAGYKAKNNKQSFSGKRVSLDFQNVDIRTILQILSKEANMNIIASDDIQGKMTLTLKDVPWDQALALILDTYDLVKVEQGNIIRIAQREEVAKRFEKQLEEDKKKTELEPILSRTFQLKYKNVEEFKDILKLGEGTGSADNKNSILTARGSALIDPSTNTLIVNDIASVIKKFEKLIEELDVASQQVMVEARIVEASEGVERNLGVKFGYARRGTTAWGKDFNSAINNRNADIGHAETTLLGPNVNLPLASAVNSIALVRSVASGALGLELEALEKDNRAKTVSNPRVLTQDRKEAVIKQGIQIPYQTRDKDNNPTTGFKDAVLSLKVTPRITPDSKIILDVAINKDDIDRTYTNLVSGELAIATKQVTTQAMVEDGGTLVVGGIYQETFSNVMNKVPLLGDLPVVGNLFKSRARDHSRNELLFFITPRIMGGESNVMRY